MSFFKSTSILAASGGIYKTICGIASTSILYSGLKLLIIYNYLQWLHYLQLFATITLDKIYKNNCDQIKKLKYVY